MIGSKTGSVSNAQAAYFAELHDLGCIACRLFGVGWTPPEMDHRNVGDLAGMPRTDGGHADVLPLCCWHHRGIPWEGWTTKATREACGPSKQLEKRQFIARFGTIEELHEQLATMLGRQRDATSLRRAR